MSDPLRAPGQVYANVGKLLRAVFQWATRAGGERGVSIPLVQLKPVSAVRVSACVFVVIASHNLVIVFFRVQRSVYIGGNSVCNTILSVCNFRD